MNGVQSLVEILAVNPQARVVMMTGFSEASVLDQARRAGAMDILRKPFRMRELLGFIDRLHDGSVYPRTDTPTAH
jgi:FixJ family two-component response regulator